MFFITNGSGGCGKDTMVEILSKKFTVKKFSTIDPIKKVAMDLGWNGEKTEKARKYLSDLKDLSTDFLDYSFKYISNIVKEYQKEISKDIIYIIDIREPPEIKRVVENFPFIKTILITRESNEEITSNHADRNVKNYDYDFYIKNNSTLVDFEKTVNEFIVNHRNSIYKSE